MGKMKKFTLLLLIFLFCSLVFANPIPSVDLEQVDTFFSVGSTKTIPLIKFKSKFKTTEKRGATVQVKREEDFPQKVNAGQRLAVFLDNINPKDHLSLKLFTKIGNQIEYSSIPAMELRYNGNIFYRMLQCRGRDLNLIIPASWYEKGLNILEIRNLGLSPIEFKGIEIRKYLFPARKNVESKKKPSNHDIPGRMLNLVSSTAKTAEANSILREKAARFLPYKMIQYQNGFDRNFPLGIIARQKQFFDPFTGKPILAYYALKTISPLFEGNPAKILSDLFPVTQRENLNNTVWSSVKNNPYTVTCGISASPEDQGKYMKLLLPIPWTGETEMEIIRGILPGDSKINTQWLSSQTSEKEKITIHSGVFKKKLRVKDFCLIRLVKAGEKPPKAIQFPQKYTKKPIKLNKAAFSINSKRPDPQALRNPLLEIKSEYQPKNPSLNYQTGITPATKGNIGKIKDVAPWDSKSVKIEISYPDGKSFDEEWAAINLKPWPEKFDYFSFWVYPTSSNRKTNKVTLLIYFQDKSTNSKDKKYKFQAVNLKTGLWQRVTLPNENCLFKKNFRIVGHPKLPEYKNGGKVSFEFNGFCTVGIEHPQYGKSGLESIRSLSGKENILIPATNKTPEKTIEMQVKKLILTGFPEKYFEYRYAFPEPVKFHKISALSKIKGIELIWHQDAQILEIKGKFPGKDYQVSETLTNLLTAKEKAGVRSEKAIPIGIKLLYEK